MYARVIDNSITEVAHRLPGSAQRLEDGAWLCPPDGEWTIEQAQSCGWYEVVDTARPADTATTTFDRSIELVAGEPTVVWTERPKTAEELAAAQQDANRSTIETNLLEDLTLIQAILDDTNANINSNPAARIKELGRSLRRLIKHELSQFDTAE